MERKAIYTSENVGLLIEKGREWNFHESDTQEHLHSLHPYPAKFIPQIPRKAISEWSEPGDLVYDPFSGSGTTLLEASLLDRKSVGTDNNSVAVLVTKAKIADYKKENLTFLSDFLKSYDEVIKKTNPDKKLIPDNKNFPYWFTEDVILRLSSIKKIILKQFDPIQTLLLAVFSSIIVRVSLQDSDTRYSRVNKKVSPSDVDNAFKSRLKDAIQGLTEIMLYGRAESNVFEADSRSVPFIKSNSVSLIITSPPYLNAYDYHKYHRQRIHWIGGSVEFARDLEIGSHDEFTRKTATEDQYFKDMDLCFWEWERVMKSDAKCIIVVGDAIVNKKAVYVADTFVELLKKRGVILEDRFIRTLHATKRAFNGQSRINMEHILVFKKK
jgi:DNA modification methylase